MIQNVILCLLVIVGSTLPHRLAGQERPPAVEELIARVRPSVATIRVRGRDGDDQGVGTGFVVDPDGLIATNFHVIGEGREFSVELPSGRTLPVLAVEASDRTADLTLIRVATGDRPLAALPLAAADTAAAQGLRVLAFGNPLGLRDSVVEGIVSAVRPVDGRELIQLAMPIEPGNSGGPLVDLEGTVRGIVNMKSAVDENLGFAIPIDQLRSLMHQPNPVAIDRWVRIGRIDRNQWTPRFGARWQQRGGLITARGVGDGFGGRSLCLSTVPPPELPYEVGVRVRLDDESGAAGIAFCGDGQHLHYGFYPSGGRLRLSCFLGPTVYSWQVLQEVDSEHYFPGQWNRLRVRIAADGLKCFVNGHLVIESRDQQLERSGKIGLVKFRQTNPDFRTFRIGRDLTPESLSREAERWFESLDADPGKADAISTAQIKSLGSSGAAASNALVSRAKELDRRAERLRKLAADVALVPTLAKLRELFAASEAGDTPDLSDSDGAVGPSDGPNRLFEGVLLIAALDNADVDIAAYQQRVDEMAAEIRERFDESTSEAERLQSLNRFLFKENGFHGARSEYYHPANSHMNRVIDDREGLPITLSILYMELGRRIGLQIEGVGLPGHFVVKQVDQQGAETLIDVFDGGRTMPRAEAARLVAATGRLLGEDDLRAQTAAEILSRVLRNLIGIAGAKRDGEALRKYAEALVEIQPESTEYRMMRAQLRALTDRREAAIEDLDWLIEQDPSALNRAAAVRMRESLLSGP